MKSIIRTRWEEEGQGSCRIKKENLADMHRTQGSVALFLADLCDSSANCNVKLIYDGSLPWAFCKSVSFKTYLHDIINIEGS